LGGGASFRDPPRPLIPHYLGELIAFQVKRTLYPILLSMWVMSMLTIICHCVPL
jgi:hypothetical protein